jgi:uncharacterized protein
MQTHTHLLPSATPGTRRELISWHFGAANAGPKVYIQAALHADEWPSMLVAHHLKMGLLAVEQKGRIKGEVVLVPAANPIGLAQRVQGHALGRFDLANGQNFNRGYPLLSAAIIEKLNARVPELLTKSSADYVRCVREIMALQLEQSWQDQTDLSETVALKFQLMRLALGADTVLDLHCDHEAVMHLYTGTPHADKGQLLAQLLGAQALITATESGDYPFDEALARPWWDAQTHVCALGLAAPLGCFSTTVELRGQADMSHEQAAQDAGALMQFLAYQGAIDIPLEALPPALCQATALQAVEPLTAPHGGMVVHLQKLGSLLAAGAPVVEIIDPFSSQSTVINTRFGGRLYARAATRFVAAGARLAKIAGTTPYRSGKLLSE